MSSKGSSTVAERRLRPLWDAIDSRQYKTALKLATSLLSKHPDSVYLIVLKALVLERMGKPEEALTLCEQAKASGPIDDLTLSTLQIVFQRLDHSEQATLCYEHACSKSPSNPELMMGLFNCHVRDYSFLKQQQVAMKMHKFFGEERFLLWAVCSIQLQVCCGNGDKALLSLAEALLKKRLDTHGLEELEALLVYVTLLEHEGKFEAAVDVLSSKSGELFSIINDKLKLKGKLLLASRQYERAAKVFQEVLETSSDDWATFLHYLDATLEVSNGGASTSDVLVDYGKMRNERTSQASEASVSGLSNEEADKRLEKASTFILRLQNNDQHELRRGPFLGSIEIEKRRFLLRLGRENNHSSENSLHTSVVDYFKRFGHMVSFASDIRGYLEFIQRYCCGDFLELLYEACNKAEGEPAVKLLRKKVSLFQVEMQLGSKAGASDKDIALQAMDIAKLYVEGLKLSKDLDSQENMHGEELITLATSSLIQLFVRTRHPGYVVEAILLLEFGLAVRKYSFQYKMMLISLYSTLFCASAAFEWYKTLDVKNILVETLSHHMLPPLIGRSVLWSELDSMLNDTTKFHEDYVKEAADLVILAYRHCNYSKVLEFVQFKDRLQYSHNLLVTKVEGSILQLTQKAHNLDEVMVFFENIDYGHEASKLGTDENLATLSFNEALETRPWWSPAPGECILTGTSDGRSSLQQREPKEQVLLRQENWRHNLCRRCLLPRLIYLSLGVVGFRDGGREKLHVDELKHLVEKYGKTLGFSWEKLQDHFADLSPVRSYLTDLDVEASDVFSLALFWTAYQIALQPSTEALSNLNDLATYFIAELTSFTKIPDTMDWKPSHLDMVASWSSLPSLVCIITEAFTWYSLCLQMWLRSLQPAGKTGKKKKKGAAPVVLSDVSADCDRPNLLVALHTCADVFCNQLETLMSWLAALSKALKASDVHVYLDLLERGNQAKLIAVSDATLMPGLVLHALESSPHSINEMSERIAAVFQTWRPDPVLKKMVDGQCATLHNLTSILLSRLKALQAVRF